MDDRDAILKAYDVSRETSEKLDIIAGMLAEWSKTRNLVGPRELEILWSRHIADSLQLCELLSGARRVVDLGSGAGFPGLIIAAALDGVRRVTLVESVGKKCEFLEAVSEAAGLPAVVLNQRIEALDVAVVPGDVVTARALAPLPKLLNFAAPWFRNGAFGVFPKGQKWEEELTAASEQWTFDHKSEVSRTSKAARILIISNLRGRP